MLIEYRPAIEPVLEAELPASGESGGHGDAEWEQLRQRARRLQVLVDCAGKRVSPYFVLDQLDRDIELQRRLLSEKDRELYEEIIMHSVGRIIRERIGRAEQWVRRIRDLMAERDTSSGLTFDLRWRPRTAESEDEMDTKDLVDLLRANPSLLKEEDVTRVVKHFRSRIDHAREMLAEGRQGDTLHGAIKEVLDYRQWFSFTLYYNRHGERERELTNNAFYKFSGGEKAMAMYIPLLSAAFSRYSEARNDAPYVISLDEAFAGVDENNVRDMFDLLRELSGPLGRLRHSIVAFYLRTRSPEECTFRNVRAISLGRAGASPTRVSPGAGGGQRSDRRRQGRAGHGGSHGGRTVMSMDERLADAVEFFRREKGLHRLIDQVIQKYRRTGDIRGKVRLDRLDDAERTALSELFRTDYSARDSVAIPDAIARAAQAQPLAMWAAACSEGAVLNVPLRELVKAQSFRPFEVCAMPGADRDIGQAVSGGPTAHRDQAVHADPAVLVIENSGVFSAVLDAVLDQTSDQIPDGPALHIRRPPMICTHGQFKLAAWKDWSTPLQQTSGRCSASVHRSASKDNTTTTFAL